MLPEPQAHSMAVWNDYQDKDLIQQCFYCIPQYLKPQIVINNKTVNFFEEETITYLPYSISTYFLFANSPAAFTNLTKRGWGLSTVLLYSGWN